MPATYDIGDSVRLSFTVKDVDGTLTNATTALTVTDPDGTTSNPTITNPSTGLYRATYELTKAGIWLHRWTATGAVTTAEDGQIYCEANAAQDTYATVAELKEHLMGAGATDTIDDLKLERVLRAASVTINDFCERRFFKDNTATARTYYPVDRRSALVDDFHTTTGLVIKTDLGDDGTYETTWVSTDYQLEPLGGIVRGMTGWPFWRIRAVESELFPLTGHRAPLEVTAKWGWAAIPDPIREACLLEAARLFHRKGSPQGVAGFGDFGVVRVSKFRDPDAERLAAPYARYAQTSSGTLLVG